MQNEKSNLLRAMDCFTEGVMLLNVTTDDFKIIFLNDAWARITGAALPLQTFMPILLFERLEHHMGLLWVCFQRCACHSMLAHGHCHAFASISACMIRLLEHCMLWCALSTLLHISTVAM